MNNVDLSFTQDSQHMVLGLRMDRKIKRQPSGDSYDRDVPDSIRARVRLPNAGSCGNHHYVVAQGDLSLRQAKHLGFDTTGSGCEAIGDVGDAHGVTVRHVSNNARVRTLIFCHAHPDDEALLTAGTMAKAVAAGHRVVLVMATDGAAGLASSTIDDLAATRERELATSAEILGLHRVVNLGYTDSGLDGAAEHGFATAPTEEVAEQIAQVIRDEKADIVVGYDPSGGYGHPDHLHIHRVTRAAAQATGTQLFEATLPREPIARALHAAARLRLTPPDFDPHEFDSAWTPRADITHRVNVRKHIHAKRASQAAHASQASADDGVRTLQVLAKLPSSLARLVLGTEFYVEVNNSTTEAARPSAL